MYYSGQTTGLAAGTSRELQPDRATKLASKTPVRFICRCGRMIREGDTEALERQRCPICDASLDEKPGDAATEEVPRAKTKNPRTTSKKKSKSASGRPKVRRSPVAKEPAARDADLPTTRGVTLQEIDSALRRHDRPAYWRLIGGHSSEVDWSDGWLSVLATSPFLLRMAVALIVLSSVIAVGLQAFERLTPAELPLLGVFFASLVVLPHPLGFVCRHLGRGLRLSATLGQELTNPEPDFHLVHALRALLRWMLCFLAGPLFFFWGAYWYWLHCGELAAIDWFILAELLACGSGLLFVSLLSVELTNGVVPNPIGVLRTINQLGWRFFLFAGLSLVAVATPGTLAIMALASAQTLPFAGFLWMASAWLVGLYLAAGIVGLLGSQYRRCRSTRSESRVHRVDKLPTRRRKLVRQANQ